MHSTKLGVRNRGVIARRSRCQFRGITKRAFCGSRLRLRDPSGAQFEFTLTTIAQNLRRPANWWLGDPAHHIRDVGVEHMALSAAWKRRPSERTARPCQTGAKRWLKNHRPSPRPWSNFYHNKIIQRTHAPQQKALSFDCFVGARSVLRSRCQRQLNRVWFMALAVAAALGGIVADEQAATHAKEAGRWMKRG